MTVITISRQYSSNGDEIASRVCEILGYRAFDKNMIAKAAREAGLSDEELGDFSEENRRMHSFFERLFGWAQLSAAAQVWSEDLSGVGLAESLSLTERSVVDLVEKAINSAHEMGNMVIVGRGGQMILRDRPDVLHVRIEAPMEERLQRVKQQLKKDRDEFYADIDIRRDAQDLIERKDSASQDYIQTYYHKDWAEPLLYHLVLNAGKLSVEQAARLIASLARLFEEQEKPAEQAMA